MSEFHIKNHFVPECYLKRWEGQDKKVQVYRILVSHPNQRTWIRNSPASIAYQKHLYTQVIAGSESDEIERWLDKEYESPAECVLEKAVNNRKLSPDDWNILIRFLAAQDVRTPARLLEHLKRSENTFSKVLQDTLDKLKTKIENKDCDFLRDYDCSVKHAELIPLKITTHIDPEKHDGVLKLESYVGRSTWIFSIKHLLDQTEKVLHDHKWSIVKPARGHLWFTSDNPVIKLNYTNPTQYDLKGGWGKKKGNIIFPIGPEHAMFVQIGDKPPLKGQRLSLDQTFQFRKFIAENAYRMIYSKQIEKDIESLRPRVIDKDRVLKERAEMDYWHKANSDLEKEYIKSNRKA